MKCKECNNEMLRDKVVIEGYKEIAEYKCANKNCSNYGYKQEQSK